MSDGSVVSNSLEHKYQNQPPPPNQQPQEPSPELEAQNELARRVNGPPRKGEYIWRVSYRVKEPGHERYQPPQVMKILARTQTEAKDATRVYFLHMKGQEVVADSAYNGGQASSYAHWWWKEL
jgi:hypothetical protein